ncbi:hypothetical protein Hte_008403 [Hypoxylon texense]
MRFLNALVAKEIGVLQVVEKNANQVPEYAILSHTWEDDEIKFEDIECGRVKYVSAEAIDETSPSQAKSLSKLRGACIQAANDGFEYIWVDSCCIDKRNSAELSEAINSMFAWYRDAAVCYAFLLNAPNELSRAWQKAQFAENRWFQRGFTLQELLAPRHVIFFSDKWVPVGEKRLQCDFIATITGIDADILRGDRLLTSASVARRMSWAAKRQTTRPEDSAYCLMGIFSVNMPMLYGEGAEKAFIRLQEEIMKQSDDQSLFAWTAPNCTPNAIHGLLASSPSFFLHSSSIMPHQDWEPRAPYAVTNRGLRIDLHLNACGGGMYVAALDCPVPPDHEDSSFVGIYLSKLSDTDEQYVRVRIGQLARIYRRGELKTVYVRQKPTAQSSEGAYPRHIIHLQRGPPPNPDRYVYYRLIAMVYPAGLGLATPPPLKQIPDPGRNWVPASWPLTILMDRKPRQLSAALIFERNDGNRLLVMIGTLSGFDIAFDAHDLKSEIGLYELPFSNIQARYEPSKATRFKCICHKVSISATPVIRSSFKYYMVDIDIEATQNSLDEEGQQGICFWGR